MDLLDFAEELSDTAWGCRSCGAVLSFPKMRKHVKTCAVLLESVKHAEGVRERLTKAVAS